MKNKIICVSCFKAIKTKNLNKHYRTKTHIRNAKQMKITFDPEQVEEDLKHILQREEWENEIKEMELNEKIEESRNEMNDRTE